LSYGIIWYIKHAKTLKENDQILSTHAWHV